MNPKTLLVSFGPYGEKDSMPFLRSKKYVEEILCNYDLGDLIQCTYRLLPEYLTEHNPYIVIVTSNHTGEEIRK
jgi:hypothetical protein